MAVNPILANVAAGAEIGQLIGSMLQGTPIREVLPQQGASMQNFQPSANQFAGRNPNEVGIDELLALLQQRR